MYIVIKRLLFYWVISFSLAISLYYALRIIVPNFYVFGLLFRMFVYHIEHPIAFIAIPCFFYGIVASAVTEYFIKLGYKRQILITIVIQFLTITISCPFGGMLWHYYDMKAGYFPSNWFIKMIQLGFENGLKFGWLVIIFSVPYNIIGSITCYFLTKKGSEFLKHNK